MLLKSVVVSVAELLSAPFISNVLHTMAQYTQWPHQSLSAPLHDDRYRAPGRTVCTRDVRNDYAKRAEHTAEVAVADIWWAVGTLTVTWSSDGASKT